MYMCMQIYRYILLYAFIHLCIYTCMSLPLYIFIKKQDITNTANIYTYMHI